jgi:hypothetical protein
MTNGKTGSLIGAVVASKPQYEPLNSPFDLATNEHATLVLKPLAHALGALRASLESLTRHYGITDIAAISHIAQSIPQLLHRP